MLGGDPLLQRGRRKAIHASQLCQRDIVPITVGKRRLHDNFAIVRQLRQPCHLRFDLGRRIHEAVARAFVNL